MVQLLRKNSNQKERTSQRSFKMIENIFFHLEFNVFLLEHFFSFARLHSFHSFAIDVIAIVQVFFEFSQNINT